jgi:hypothetical protein
MLQKILVLQKLKYAEICKIFIITKKLVYKFHVLIPEFVLRTFFITHMLIFIKYVYRMHNICDDEL